MIRHLQEIQVESTSHGVGEKRVLLGSNESGCSLTQIAITELKQGDVAVSHIHPDIQEAFYVLDGEIEAIIDGKATICPKGSFIYIERCTSHEIKAISNTRIMTIGCSIEENRDRLYPLLFRENRKTLIWGTEDWTVSAIPGSESEIKNGIWTGCNLANVISRNPSAYLGRQTAIKHNNQLPLLAKIIDAHTDLSIQVHPNDDMAKREHNKLGKSEMWYILEAKPGAYLYAGFKQQINSREYKKRVEDGTITEVLAKHEVRKGDVFYLPAGRVHAICGGIRLAEIQQSSDVTYRIYDYNRPGLDGKPRELHTELATKAIDYNVYSEYKTEHREDQESANKLLNTPFFSVKVVETTLPFHRNMIKYDSFIIMLNFGENCQISIRSTKNEITLPANASCLIPAAIADYDIIPIKGKAKVLEAFINNKKSITDIVSDFFHSS